MQNVSLTLVDVMRSNALKQINHPFINKLGKYGFNFTFFNLGTLDEYGHRKG